MKTVLISIYSYNSFGIRSLYSVLKEKNFDTSLIFFKEPIHNTMGFPTDKEFDLLLAKIKDLNPDVIGMGVLSPFFEIAKEISKRIKKQFPNKIIILGGHHAMICPEECVQISDILCIGEGEEVIPELLTRLSNGKKVTSMEGLWFKKKNGTIIKNKAGMLIQNLDVLPTLDYKDENKYCINDNTLKEGDPLREHSVISILLSRGCPLQCSYCTTTILMKLSKGSYVRHMGAKRAIKELEHVKKSLKNIKYIIFADEIFLTDKQWLREFSKEYKQKIKLPFRCNLYPLMVNDEMISLLKSAGLESCFVGIESGSEKIRREVYNRFVSDEQILKAASILKKHGILTYYDLILDNPYETNEDLNATFNLCLKLPRPFNFQVYSLNNFPKTALTEKMLKEGLIKDWDRTKTLKQWRFTLNKPNFWYALILLTSKSFIPKSWLYSFSKSKFLKENPQVLTFVCKSTNIIKLFPAALKFLAMGMSYTQIRRYIKKSKTIIQ